MTNLTQAPNQMENVDEKVVCAFGQEWTRFDQRGLCEEERRRIFDLYFAAFPWDKLPPDGGEGVDVGCGTGRWAMLVAPRVRTLHVLDASAQALGVARQNLAGIDNVVFHHASVGRMPMAEGSLDFAYSLGVLHHVPDTQAAIRSISRVLKRGAPFLVYLYYAFDNRPWSYRQLWRMSDLLRRGISRMPRLLRSAVCEILAAAVYWPLARMALILDRLGMGSRNWPLTYYKDKSFYLMRTCALDRFGTRLEQRFSQKDIIRMLTNAGFEDIHFSDTPPFWCASALKGPIER